MNKLIFGYVIIPILLFLASLATIVWILLPMWHEAQAALEVKKLNEMNLADRRQLSANLEKLVGQYNERINDVAFFGKSVPVGGGIPELLVNLETLASENGLIFSGVEVKQKEFKPAGIKTLVLELKLKGSYQALQNYLKAAEKSIRLLDVAAVSFSGVAPGQLEAKINDLEFGVIVNAYYQ